MEMEQNVIKTNINLIFWCLKYNERERERKRVWQDYIINELILLLLYELISKLFNNIKYIN